jgi:hypothetical protein
MGASKNDDTTGPPTSKMSTTGELDSLRQIRSKRTATRSDWIGTLDASTGAHQMLRNLLEPENARYAASEFGNIDACVQYAVPCWPVADPLARHQMALRHNNERLIVAQNAFFSSEQENGGRKSANDPQTCTPDLLPPLLLLRGTKDGNVTPDMAASVCRRMLRCWQDGAANT